jgi:hypothetical protein
LRSLRSRPKGWRLVRLLVPRPILCVSRHVNAANPTGPRRRRRTRARGYSRARVGFTGEFYYSTPVSSSVEGTRGAFACALLSRGRTGENPHGALRFTRNAPGGFVRKSPSYRMGAPHVVSTTRGARVRDNGCSGRSGWGKSTEASGRRGGGRKRDRKARGPWPLNARRSSLSRASSSDQHWHASV